MPHPSLHHQKDHRAPNHPHQPLEFKLRPYHRDTPNIEILFDLRRVAAALNSPTLTQKAYRPLARFSCSTVIRRFGTWNSAVTSARLKPSILMNTTPQQLLTDIRRVAKKLRTKKLHQCQYTKLGNHSSMVIQRHFKSWQNASLAAGLTPAKFQNIPTSHLLADIEQVWRRLNRQPTYNEMYPLLSRYNVLTHCRHFGSFQSALKTFIKHINSHPERNPERSRRAYPKHAELIEQRPGKVVESLHPLSPRQRAGVRAIAPNPSKYSTTNPRHSHSNFPQRSKSINYRLRYLTLRRDHYRCRACGRSPATHPGTQLQIDHIIPTSRGGKSTPSNLQSLCQTCNIGKSNLDWKTKKAHGSAVGNETRP
jgi:5-methylcytosine-specific restriction endonuclease McrA